MLQYSDKSLNFKFFEQQCYSNTSVKIFFKQNIQLKDKTKYW